MAVETTNAHSGPFIANGATTAFPFSFSAMSGSEVSVFLRSADGTETTVNPVDYSVTLAGAAPSSGTVSFTSPPESGYEVLILLDPEFTQETQFENGSPWLAAPVNNANDRAALRDQMLKRDVDRAIKVAIDDEPIAFPTASARANKIFGFDEVGDLLLESAESFVSSAVSAAAGLVNFRSTLADGVADFAVGEFFSSSETGELRLYKRIVGAPFYLDQGDAAAPVTKALLAADTGGSAIGMKGPLPDEVPTTAYLNFIEVKNVARWGVEPGNTAAANRTAFQKAINSATKIELVLPDGDTKINDLLTTPQDSIVYFSGQGCGVSRLLQTDMARGAIKFDMNYAQGGGVNGLTIASDVSAGAQGSSGIGLQVVNANDQFMAKDFEVVSFDKCVRVDGSFQPTFKDFRLLYFADYGVFLSPYVAAGSDTAGTRWRNGKVSNYGYLGASPENSTGLLIHQGSGEYFDTIDITQAGIPVKIAPPAGSFARFLKFQTVLADTAYYEGWWVDGSTAPAFNIRMLDCWASGAGGGALRPVGSVRGAGLLTKGSQLDDVTWIGGELRDNDCGGWRHEGGANVRVLGAAIARNSRRVGFDNQYPGVAVAAGVSNWAVKDCRIGNFSLGVFNVSQAEAIVIEAGASANFEITGNDLSNPGAGKAYISNGSTTTDWEIKDNLPNQKPFINYNRAANFSGSTVGTIAANLTRYLAVSGQQVSETDSYMVVADPGWVRQFIVQTTAAPGAAQSYTYNVRKNGANTVMAGTITGTGTFQLILTSGFVVAVGDILSIELLTSAGAAAAGHRWSLNVES